MTYTLNTLGRETIENFVRNNAESGKRMDEYFEEANEKANCGLFDMKDGIAAVWIDEPQSLHSYEVMLILRAEHYDNV